jgi:hypothetical protein
MSLSIIIIRLFPVTPILFLILSNIEVVWFVCNDVDGIGDGSINGDGKDDIINGDGGEDITV